MGRKRKKTEVKPFCYYCGRGFTDDATLLTHQKARHFKCGECHRKLMSAYALKSHMFLVHKLELKKVPNSKEGRESVEFDIMGMEGVPFEAIQARQKQEAEGKTADDGPEDADEDDESKKANAAASQGAAPASAEQPVAPVPGMRAPVPGFQFRPPQPGMGFPGGFPSGMPFPGYGPGMPFMGFPSPQFGMPPFGGPMGMPGMPPMPGMQGMQGMPGMAPPAAPASASAPPLPTPSPATASAAATGSASAAPVASSPFVPLDVPAAAAAAPPATSSTAASASEEKEQVVFIYKDDDESMEEKRAKLRKYRVDDNVKAEVSRLSDSISARLKELQSQTRS